jgi:ferredoxin-NADP reductase
MPVQKCIAALSDRQQLTEKFQHLYFEMKEPNVLAFEAGQYVSIGFPDSPLRRSYSIASSPVNTHGFELLIDTTPQGIGTKYLTGLAPGAEISCLAPMGVFVLAKDEQAAKEKSLVFVATGSGVAPLRSMILWLLQTQNDQRQIWLYWGLRYEQDMFWEDEFQEMSQLFPNFHFHITLSRAGQEWPLCRGRVTDCLSIHQLPPDAGYYLCGNKPMIEEVSALLAQKGIPKEFVHHEKFY